MESNLQFHHIAKRMPFRLQYIILKDSGEPERPIINNHSYCFGYVNTTNISDVLGFPTNYKILLRPIEDLTKIIKHNGKQFIPILELFGETARFAWYGFDTSEGKSNSGLSVTYDLMGETVTEIIFTQNSFSECRKRTYDKLLEWQFNVDFLPEDQFININTLDENHYL